MCYTNELTFLEMEFWPKTLHPFVEAALWPSLVRLTVAASDVRMDDQVPSPIEVWRYSINDDAWYCRCGHIEPCGSEPSEVTGERGCPKCTVDPIDWEAAFRYIMTCHQPEEVSDAGTAVLRVPTSTTEELIQDIFARWSVVAKNANLRLKNFKVNPAHADPDGPHVPLPKHEPLTRAISAPEHDFIAALYRPYRSPI